jgi:adenylate cyclase
MCLRPRQISSFSEFSQPLKPLKSGCDEMGNGLISERARARFHGPVSFKSHCLPIAIGLSLAAVAFAAYQIGLLAKVELHTLDLRFIARGSAPVTAPIVLVSIDQDSFDELNLPWPWPRDLHATIVRKLSRTGARIIGLDILFTEPKIDGREDSELAAAISEAGNVVLAAELTEVMSDFGPKLTMSLPISAIREQALGYGPVNLVTDVDGTVRRARPALSFQGKLYPSFASVIEQAASAASPFAPEGFDPEPQLINFRGPPRTYPVVPYYRILRDEIDAATFRDKIVLIGSFAPSLHDVFGTPFSASQPMAGVEIQANLIETLSAANPIVPLAGWQHALILSLISGLAIWPSIRLKPVRALAAVFAVAVLFLFGCVLTFTSYDLWVPMTPTILAIALSHGALTLNNYIREQRERMRQKAQFSKYFSPDVVEEILEDREGLALAGKRRHITVLFSDIRGFTGISEKIAPEQVVSFLSDYFAQVTEIVFRNRGTLDKFIGDGVMAVFGSPRSYGDDALRAVKTGLEMIKIVEKLDPKWDQLMGRALKIGVGINSGDAVVGSIGSELRSDFTAIGDVVNLAARLESLTKELEVPLLISEFTVAELPKDFPLKRLQKVKVQGRDASLLVYTAVALHEGRETPGSETGEPYEQRHK